MFATNPSMCAVAQTQDPRNDARDRGDLAQLVLLSLGTGHALQYIEGSHDWGQLQWVRPLIDLMLDGVNGIADYQCRHLLHDRYYRFAPTFEPGVTIGQDAVDQIPFLVDYAWPRPDAGSSSGSPSGGEPRRVRSFANEATVSIGRPRHERRACRRGTLSLGQRGARCRSGLARR